MRVCADPRFEGDEFLHCPVHGTRSAWVSEVVSAWHWSRKGRPLSEYVRRASAWVLDACLFLDGESAALDAETQRRAIDDARDRGSRGGGR